MNTVQEQRLTQPTVVKPNALQKLRRNVWRLAMPAVVEQLLVMSVGIIDTAMVGRLGPTAIASVDLSNRIIQFALAIFAAIQIGTTAIVARHIGAGEQKDAAVAAKQSLLLVGLLGLILSVLAYIFAPNLIGFMMLFNEFPDPLVIDLAATYMRIVLFSMPFNLITMTVNAILRGAGDTKTPMFVTGLNNFINIIGNAFLIFGLGPFPRLEVAGAAISTACAQIFGMLLVVYLVYSGRSSINLRSYGRYRFESPMLRRILRVGLPAAVEQFLMRGGQLVFSMIIAGIGTTAIAAHAIALNAESLSFMPGWGFSVAVTTLVGQYLGSCEPELAERACYEGGKLSALVMTTMGVIFFLFPSVLIRFFTSDQTVIELASKCLRLVAISQPFLAWLQCFSGALRGAGDTRWVMIGTAVSLWPIRVGLSYYLVIVMGAGLIGAWVGMVVDLIVRCSLMAYRFRTGKWKAVVV